MSRSDLVIAAGDRFSMPDAGVEFSGLTTAMVASSYAIALAACAAAAGISLDNILSGSPVVAAVHLLAIPLLALPCLGTLIGRLRRKEGLRLWGAFAYLAAIFVTMEAYCGKPFDAAVLKALPFQDGLAASLHLLPPVLLVAVLTWLTVETLERRKRAAKFIPAQAAGQDFRVDKPRFAAAA